MTLQEMLDDALAARHRLAMGMSVVEVSVADGHSTKFKAAELDRLEAYIAQLRADISGAPTRGAIGFIID